MDRKLIVGLGNPGQKYENNRHNIGANIVFVLDAMLSAANNKKGEHEVTKEYAVIRHAHKDKEIHLMMPLMFMNNSGKAIKKYMTRRALDVSSLFVIYDAEEVKLGQYKFVSNVSHRGHNGVRNIIDELGSNEFKRVKIGIGQTPEDMDIYDYVLSDFTDEELSKIDAEDIAKAILEEI